MALAEEFAGARFAGFAELELLRAQANEPSDTSATPTSFTATWQKRAADSGALLPLCVSVDVSLQTGRVWGYQAERGTYDGPTVPKIGEAQALQTAVAEADKSPTWAEAVASAPQLQVVRLNQGYKLVWIVEFENAARLLTDILVDALTGEVLNPLGS